MKAAVDSNILFDLLIGEPPARRAAAQVLSSAATAGPVVLCPVVHSELAAGFEDQQTLEHFLADLGLEFEGFTHGAVWEAGRAWRIYTRRRERRFRCPRCGSVTSIKCPHCGTTVVWRQHMIADFLIGAHAVTQTDLLITRDIGYYRTYFPELKLLTPAAGVV